jgi:hypothetical protein
LLQDECSFVSLRDVDRALCVMMWFYAQRTTLFHKIDDLARNSLSAGPIEELREALMDSSEDANNPEHDAASYKVSADLVP